MRKNDLTRCIFNVRDNQMCELIDPGKIIGYITKEASKIFQYQKVFLLLRPVQTRDARLWVFL
jgi:membrane protease subunit (stomatin/prohibitin family)